MTDIQVISHILTKRNFMIDKQANSIYIPYHNIELKFNMDGDLVNIFNNR